MLFYNHGCLLWKIISIVLQIILYFDIQMIIHLCQWPFHTIYMVFVYMQIFCTACLIDFSMLLIHLVPVQLHIIGMHVPDDRSCVRVVCMYWLEASTGSKTQLNIENIKSLVLLETWPNPSTRHKSNISGVSIKWEF